MIITLKTRYLPNEQAKAVPGYYGNGTLALQFTAAEGEYVGEPLTTATVNLEAYGIHPAPGNLIIKTAAENEGLLESLINNGLVGMPTAWYSYGLVEFGAAEVPLTEKGKELFATLV